MIEFPQHMVEDVLTILRKYSDSSGLGNDLKKSTDSATIVDLEADANLLASLLAGALRRRNALLPIYRLPREILIIMFQIIQDSEAGYKKYEVIKHFARVSSYWCTMVLSTPQLWRTVDIVYIARSRTPSMRTIIQRSKGVPLDIELRRVAVSALQDLTSLVVPQVDRWRTLRVGDETFCSNGLPRLIGDEVSLPQLEHFELTGFYGGLEVPDWIQSRAPRLHTLCIIPTSFPFGAQVLSTVRRLEFTPIIEGFELSPQQWKTLLCSSPQLELLRIKGTWQMKRKETTFPPFHAFIPNLQKISLVKLSSSIVGALISSICVDPKNLPRIEILELTNENQAVDDLFPVSPQPQSLWSLIQSTTRISASCQYIPLNMEAGGGPNEVSFHLRTSDSQPEVVAASIFESLLSSGFPNLLSLDLEGPYLFRGGMVIRNLSHLSKLKRFGIANPNFSLARSDYCDNLADLCEALSLPSISAEAQWPLPELRELKVSVLDRFEALVSLIDARYGLHALPEVTKYPPPLDTLEIRHPPPEYDNNYRWPIEPADITRLHEILDGTSTKLAIFCR